jgi:hypothetical protein
MIAYLTRMMTHAQLRERLVDRMAVALAAAFLALCLVSCGGGTRGSGGQFYDGFVGDPAGKALPNVTVTLLASGDSGVSDARGRFVIETQALAGALDVLLERDDFQATTTTAPVPADAKRVRLNLTVSSGQRPTVTSSVEVVERTEGGSGRRPGESGRDDEGDDDSRDDSSGSDGSLDDDDRGESGNDDGDDDADSRDDSDDDRDDNQDDSSGGSGGGSSGPDDGGRSGDDGEAPRDGDTKRAEGELSRISGTTVTVSGIEFTLSSSSDLRDADGNPASLSSFSVGQKVKARGRYQSGVLVLERLELDD